MREHTRLLMAVVLVGSLVHGGWSQPPARPVQGNVNLKALTESIPGKMCTGVVSDIDAEGVTVIEKLDDNKTKTHKFVPIDLMRQGDFFDTVPGHMSYLWTDMKKGDTVLLDVMKDDGDGLTYCLSISIQRRPGAKLPKSQKPDRDSRYEIASIYNDLNNGEDVTDEQLEKLFEVNLRVYRGGKTPPKELVDHLESYRAKLQANRKRIAEEKEKKEKELKAKPAEKKDDKK